MTDLGLQHTRRAAPQLSRTRKFRVLLVGATRTTSMVEVSRIAVPTISWIAVSHRLGCCGSSENRTGEGQACHLAGFAELQSITGQIAAKL